jgi:hypothetical protein
MDALGACISLCTEQLLAWSNVLFVARIALQIQTAAISKTYRRGQSQQR